MADDAGRHARAIRELEEEARNLAARARDMGPRAFLAPSTARSGTNRVPAVNKMFLTNTILSTESHNRQEEIEGCWRHHGIAKRKLNEFRDNSESSDTYAADRDSWAMKKLRAMAGVPSVRSSVNSVGSSSSSSSSNSSDSESSNDSCKRKKKSKSKKDSVKKTAKKPKKEKKAKSEKLKKDKKRKKPKKSKHYKISESHTCE